MVPDHAREFEVWGGVAGIWSHTGGTGFASTVVPDFEGGRARLEFGFNRVWAGGQKIAVAGNYDGIGITGYESYGLSLDYYLDF